MEWKYLEKDPPKHEGKYLIYTLKGKLSINEYARIVKSKRKDGSVYFHKSTNSYGEEYIGCHFIANTRMYADRGPLEGVVLYAEIPPIPDDLDKKDSQIREYEAKIRRLREKIKALQVDD